MPADVLADLNATQRHNDAIKSSNIGRSRNSRDRLSDEMLVAACVARNDPRPAVLGRHVVPRTSQEIMDIHIIRVSEA